MKRQTKRTAIGLRSDRLLAVAASTCVLMSGPSLAQSTDARSLSENAIVSCVKYQDRRTRKWEGVIVDFKRDSDKFPIPVRGSDCDEYVTNLMTSQLDSKRELTITIANPEELPQSGENPCTTLIDGAQHVGLLPPAWQRKCLMLVISYLPPAW